MIKKLEAVRWGGRLSLTMVKLPCCCFPELLGLNVMFADLQFSALPWAIMPWYISSHPLMCSYFILSVSFIALTPRSLKTPARGLYVTLGKGGFSTLGKCLLLMTAFHSMYDLVKCNHGGLAFFTKGSCLLPDCCSFIFGHLGDVFWGMY